MDQILLEEEKESKKQYRFSLWWVNHRDQLKKIGLGILIGIDAMMVVVVFWGFLDSFAISYGKEQLAVAETVMYNQEDLRVYSVARAASPLVESDTRIFAIGDQRFDFYSNVENPNSDWWAEFTYKFTYDGGETKPVKSFILPNKTKPVVELGITSATLLRDVTFQILDTTWHRIDHTYIKDYSTWEKDRLNLEVKDAIYSETTKIEDKLIGRTSFSVENKTAFSYYHPTFYVLLKKGSSVVGVNRIVLETLESGSTQQVDLNWFGVLPSVSQIEVIPDINLFNPLSYQALGGISTIDTRTLEIRR